MLRSNATTRTPWCMLARSLLAQPSVEHTRVRSRLGAGIDRRGSRSAVSRSITSPCVALPGAAEHQHLVRRGTLQRGPSAIRDRSPMALARPYSLRKELMGRLSRTVLARHGVCSRLQPVDKAIARAPPAAVACWAPCQSVIRASVPSAAGAPLLVPELTMDRRRDT